MIVAGGLYLELCEVPRWQEYFGSGGRAAYALAELSPSSELHTYFPQNGSDPCARLERAGIKVKLYPSEKAIAFSYFHPLTRPVMVPRDVEIKASDPIRIVGQNVVRFGMIEGEAIVTAHNAVYDPQTSKAPPTFRSNGSTAGRLALVMNEGEVRSLAKINHLPDAARHVMETQGAEVLVAKGGTAGALVMTRNDVVPVPPYLTNRIFKIGTGDVFTAVFAHYWAERDLVPSEAADLASRAVAKYCETQRLPIERVDGMSFLPAPQVNSPLIEVIGRANTLGNRWVLEEAVWSLKELGARVSCASLAEATNLPSPPLTGVRPDGVLVMLDTLDDSRIYMSNFQGVSKSKILYFTEKEITDDLFGFDVVTDFASAMYRAIWVSSAL